MNVVEEDAMVLRRLGRTNLMVSTIGFGTCQLRMVPKTQGIDTLLRGFDLGVNIVHVAPDYEGAEDLVAEAVRCTDRKIIVASQAYDTHYNTTGYVTNFENLFEATCKRFRTDHLELFGVACMDDREAYQENVWGKGGMIEFLQKKKAEGRIGSTFCTTHGNPEYIRKLVESDVFDAIMIAYNVLGYHLLSYSPPEGRHFESLPRNRSEIFPLCREKDLGVMVMKPFAGGLLQPSRAFPPRHEWEATQHKIEGGDILRAILEDPIVSCVLPGTASMEEAEENARAGHVSVPLAPEKRKALDNRVTAMQASICSRCGACDSLCSKDLQVSWLFRAAYVSLHPSETFETWDEVEFFRLHPDDKAACDSCTNVTCRCEYGIDIPKSLSKMHGKMMELKKQGLTARGPDEAQMTHSDGELALRVVTIELPNEMAPDERVGARLFIENIGTTSWFAEGVYFTDTKLTVFLDDAPIAVLPLRHDVHPRGRCHFSFEIQAPAAYGSHALRLVFTQKKPAHILHNGKSNGNGSSGPEYVMTIFDGKITTKPAAKLDAKPFAAVWRNHNIPATLQANGQYFAYFDIQNSGSKPWPAGMQLVSSVNRAPQSRATLDHEVKPGETWTATVTVFYELKPAECDFSFALEQAGATFDPLNVHVTIVPEPADATTDLLKISRSSNGWHYWISQGLRQSSDGRPYPLFIRKARGCRITDTNGNEWLDYVMGWGSALLGYAHPEIEAAIAAELGSGAILGLPHELEMRVSALLCEMIPCAESVFFGKNGSDVCTAAIRLARVHTGRRKVLFTGYHGWQDWYAEALEPALAQGTKPSAFRFNPNDFDDFHRVLSEHAGEVAAVILEPAGQVESTDGPVADPNPEFLRRLQKTCKEQNIVLIFDEIITGFRYEGFSVQAATGIVPDLACFGKALTSSMPLSALVGRRDIIAGSVGKIFYHPTFKGESYSYAAAIKALEIYKRENVGVRVRAYGQHLMQGINGVARACRIDGQMAGLPYRMVFKFEEPDYNRLVLKRTLLHQELTLRGLLTFRGFMLPSLAHGDAEYQQTLDIYEASLRVVKKAEEENSFGKYIEIPLVH